MTGGSWYTKLGPAGDVGRITVLGSMERAKDAQELLHTIAKVSSAVQHATVAHD